MVMLVLEEAAELGRRGIPNNMKALIQTLGTSTSGLPRAALQLHFFVTSPLAANPIKAKK
jgi:hypothetical protein